MKQPAAATIIAKPHISICVCSYKRPQLLKSTLDHLLGLTTNDLFDYSIVIADNDIAESARSTVETFARATDVRVSYCVEPEQNIALARNKALEYSDGDYVALIDDDEFPETDWLLLLYQTLASSDGDGVLGPVKPVFQSAPPKWILEGGFFNKPRRATGLKLKWHQTSTANVLIRRRVLDEHDQPFPARIWKRSRGY